jgi:two-component system chemotaxis sensor kinase CheA
MDEILGEFIAETLETLETLSGEIVAWEADPTDKSRLDAFFRFFHTVKGSCGFLNLPRFERLAHGAEDVLAAVRRGERIPDPATVTAVLAVMDRIGALARGIGEEVQIPESDDDALLDALAVNSGSFEIFAPKQPKSGPVVKPEPVVDEEDEIRLDAVGAPHARRAGDGAGRSAAPRTIRLPLALIDQLMNGISDMVLSRNDLARKMRDHGVDTELESSFERLSANVADLRDMISKTRMQRVDRLYAAIPRMVRDLTRELDKKVTLELDGGDVEMDREMIEMVVDPLTHIVRNALDHGIEAPASRIAGRKSEAGTLRVVARQSGNQIVIEISDDGRGINRAALVEKAVSAGLYTAVEAASLNDAEKLGLIFHAGLSTAEQVTSISGRGVGMDVVRANIEQIGGVIGIASIIGQGTTITMRVPLTLTIIPGLIIRCGALFFAMPRGNVVELLHQNSATVSIETIGGARIATIRGERHALIELEDVLQLPRVTGQTGPRTLMVIRSSIGQPYVLGVPSVESNEELVIRPASPVIAAAGVFAGMTLPDNGQPMLLLDAAGLAQIAELPLREIDRQRPGAAQADAPRAETIQALIYRERDGAQRLLPLSVVDRVEDLDASQIIISDGLAFARIEDRLLPALNTDGAESANPKSLRLYDGQDQICYLIDDVIDIIEVTAKPHIRIAKGRIAGLVMVGDGQLEILDPFMLFAEAAGRHSPATDSIRCLIADAEDPWMRNILAPLLVQAGHDVSFGFAGDAAPDIILCADDQPVSAAGDVPVIALRDTADAGAGADPSIYRYDRETIMSAIARAARGVA